MGARIALTGRELKKWIRNPVYLFVSLTQPLFWILLFGSAFNITKIVPSNLPSSILIQKSIMNTYFFGAPNYISFLTPGILAIMILFTAMFSGMSMIWDRRFGFLTKLIVAPIPRDSILLSKVFASILKGLLQASVLIFIAILIPDGLKLSTTFNLVDIGILYLALTLLSLGFSSLFTVIVVKIKNMETLMGIVNLLNLPLMFASTAMFPSAIMPVWLRTVAEYNPISWAVEDMRLVMLKGSLTASQFGTIMQNLAYLGVFVVIMISVLILISKYGFEE